MPTEHIRISYKFNELDESAQEKAVSDVAAKMSGDWWDEDDNDAVGAVIRMGFAEAIGTPGTEKSGVDDFPGIDGITLESWSCGYMQSDHIGFAGSLTRENAAKLPWVDGIASVTLEAPRDRTTTWIVMDDAECICDQFTSVREPDCEAHTPNPATEAQIQAMREAIDAALATAHQAGYAKIEHIGSSEYAREWIESNEFYQFNADGTPFI